MTTISKIFGRKCSGEVGIELEYEGSNLPTEGYGSFWSKHTDNSLRGESAEYVLTSPVPRDRVSESLQALDAAMKASRTKVNDTFRAGTHIHLNVQEMTLPQVINFLTLYFMFENTLIKLCRPDRVGNHFCLRGKDAGGLLDMLYKSVTKGDVKAFGSDIYRYAAMNINSLPKFGSLEFRALESTTDWAKLEAWIAIHLAIKDASLQFRDPTTILGTASMQGFEGFAKGIFGTHWPIIKAVYAEEDVAQGVWGIQSVVFAKDWSTVNNNIFATANIFDITP